ncbi:MAG: alpha/beta fold hydrolase [Rhodobacteraceae bacterium]|nr:alpha/beta fold hydrolase [Paracoccaceae bacterium]
MTRQKQRIGNPSPLIFHLGTTIAAYHAALIAGSSSDLANFQWHSSLTHAAPTAPINRDALIHEVENRLRQVTSGLELWQNHPHHRTLTEPPVVWQAGASRLLDYGEKTHAPPVLVIPSLVNKAYILDLSEQKSLLRDLNAMGLRPFLLDWGAPQAAEQKFDLAAYIQFRALPALAEINRITGRPAGLLGYCMGGTIAAAIAQLSPDINALVTIGAPWDFSRATGTRLMMQKSGALNDGRDLRTALTNLSTTFGAVPISFIQHLFASINPIQFATKFQRFSKMDMTSEAAKTFVRIEDWLADGIALSGPAAIDLFLHWHVQNSIASGNWQVNGITIDAAKIGVPSLNICGRKDTIAPDHSTLALPDRNHNARIIRPNMGHVGMIIGTNAKKEVTEPLGSFLLEHA